MATHPIGKSTRPSRKEPRPAGKSTHGPPNPVHATVIPTSCNPGQGWEGSLLSWALGFLAQYQEIACLYGEDSCVAPSKDTKARDSVDGNVVPWVGFSVKRNH